MTAVDPTCGDDEAALRTIRPPPEPADFAAFWRATHAAALALPLDLELGGSGLRHRTHRVRTVAFTTLASARSGAGTGGFRVGGWLLEPLAGPCTSLLVQGHGYGGRGAPDGRAPRGAAVLFPCAPGFDRSARAGLPAHADAHVLHGIGDRETYLIRACVAAIWSAASVLRALHPGLPLHYAGASFGGGLGALALPWDERFSAAFLEVPTFGHYPLLLALPLRLRCPCAGSGEAVRRWHAAHPEVVEVLAYYDAAVAAARIAMPVVCAPAFADPVVPPPGQWAIANALPQGEIAPLRAGHAEHPDNPRDQRVLARRVRALLGG